MTYNFAIGLSDPAIEINQAAYMPVMPQIKAIQPAFFRLIVPWNLVATTMRPGPYQGDGRQLVTANATGSGMVGDAHHNASTTVQALASGTGRVTGIAPSQQGYDWHHVDNVINDVRVLTGADIILVVGQGKPNGWTNADYKRFCAESVQRYGPGGPGIRTDGIYASNVGWGVRYWEIWNEQNNGGFWGTAVSPPEYTALLQAGYQGVKSVLPGTPAPGVDPTGNQSVVIFGGMQHIPFEGVQFFTPYITLDEARFLQQCYVAATAMGTTLGTMFDMMATHLYPAGDPANPSPAQGPPNIISQQNIPSTATGANPRITATATGSGKVNINPATNASLLVTATATGTGVINPYETPGPAPDLLMDNMRQLFGIIAQMQANGDGAKKIAITEMGYSVYDLGLTPQLQQTYTKALLDILNTIPAIDIVLWYNSLDTTNQTATSDTSGFGLLDYNKNPRPIYDWLLTLQTLRGGGSLVVGAVATGSGSIGGAGAKVITATATGTGVLGASGGVITATATGSGAVNQAPGRGALVVTAAATGTGKVGIFAGGGALAVGGALVVTARAQGSGKVNVAPSGNGDLLVSATAFGTGRVGRASVSATIITALATGTGVVAAAPGSEVGVVGVIGNGAKIITATATGSGNLGSGDTGGLVVTATATGSGKVGKVGAGSLTVTATAVATGIVGSSGGQLIIDTALGAGVVGVKGDNSTVITATATGSGAVGIPGAGSQTVTATATGSGVVGKVGGGAQIITTTTAGAGVVGSSGGQIITVSMLGAGFVAISTGGTSVITDTATGTGAVGISGSGTRAVTATATGSGVVTVRARLPKVVKVFTRHRIR